MNQGTQLVDDKGTTQEEAREIFRAFCDNGFNGDISQAALVLGRTPDEVQGILGSGDVIDDDLMAKVRGIAETRGIDLGRGDS